MQELIDKQASMKAICGGCFKSRAVDIELKCRGTCNVIDILQQQPTIEAEPVRHGRWECGGFCSICGLDTTEHKPSFCPNCGAKMQTEPPESEVQE